MKKYFKCLPDKLHIKAAKLHYLSIFFFGGLFLKCSIEIVAIEMNIHNMSYDHIYLTFVHFALVHLGLNINKTLSNMFSFSYGTGKSTFSVVYHIGLYFISTVACLHPVFRNLLLKLDLKYRCEFL